MWSQSPSSTPPYGLSPPISTYRICIRENVTTSDYIKKMLDYSTWKKFLEREDKWKVLHSSLSDFLQKTRKGKKDRESEENIQGDRLNLQFLDALKNFVRARKNAVMVFAGNDFFLKEFKNYMLPILQSDGILDQLKVEIVPDANHIYFRRSFTG